MKLLSMCSSRNRPDKLRNMIESFLNTKELDTYLAVYVWNKDDKIKEYIKLANKFDEVIWIFSNKKMYMVEALNFISSAITSDYYQNVNDDHEFATKGWDKKMISVLEEKGGIAYVYDPDDKSQNPTCEIISGEIVRKLGYYIYPKFRQFGCERYIRELGKHVGFHHIPDVVIFHKCWHGLNKAKKDKNHKFIYSKEEINNGDSAFYEWDNNQKNLDLQKLK